MSYQKLNRNQIAERVAQDIPDGAYVNLGIGLPTKISKYLPADKDVFLHSENGLLAFGPPPAKGEEDPELINAGKEYVTICSTRCISSCSQRRSCQLAYRCSRCHSCCRWCNGFSRRCKESFYHD